MAGWRSKHCYSITRQAGSDDATTLRSSARQPPDDDHAGRYLYRDRCARDVGVADRRLARRHAQRRPIVTEAPGLGPAEVEKFITFPVEITMRGLPGIKEIRSISRFGLSSVSVYFEEQLDIYFARRLVMERLPSAAAMIPKGYGPPEMTPVSTTLGEIFQFEVVDPQRSLMELRSILDWQIAPRLKEVPGVVEINSFGGELKTYEVRTPARRVGGLRIIAAGCLSRT